MGGLIVKRLSVGAAKLIALLLLALVAIYPFLRSTLPWSADGQLHFWRVVELDHCLRNGYLYPRWMPDMAYGYGFPLLNYYAPLSVYLAEGFHLLGLDFTPALQAAFAASLGLGALGAYLWARDTFDEAGGLIAALAYTYAPYTLYDAIWRGNLAESLALGLLPWAFWRLRRLALDPGRRNLVLAALAFAALILAHNVTALIAAPLLVAYALLLWLKGGRSRQTLALLAGALLLGLFLSAFFWLPAFFERGYVQTEKMVTASHFDYRHNFLKASELFSPPVPIDVTLMNPPVPRSLSWPALLLTLLGIAALTFKPSTFQLFTLLLCTFLALPASRFLWETIPLLPYVGFPWRFLGPAGLMAAWLAGASARWMKHWQPRARSLILAPAALLITAYALTWLYPRYLEPVTDPTPAGLIAFEQESGALGTTSVGEYLPAAVQELPDTTVLEEQYRSGSTIHRLPPDSLPEGAAILSENWQLIGGDVTVNSPRPWKATLLLFHFPGWRAWLNGAKVEPIPSSPHGLLQFDVPGGETHIKIRFAPTPWRLAGTVLSLAGMAVCLAMIIPSRGESATRPYHHSPTRPYHHPPTRPYHHSPTRPYWLAALGAVGLVFVVKMGYLDTHNSPLRRAAFDGQRVAGVGTPAQIHFERHVRLLGHDPAAPSAPAGSDLTLHLYWTADATPGEEYSSFLHLLDAEGHRWGQSDNQHPGGYPTTRWRPGEYNRDTHILTVPPGTPPGEYILRAGLIDRATGAGLDVLDERGAPRGTSIVIGSVTVTRPAQPPPVEMLDIKHRLDINLGDLTLLGAGLDRRQAAPGETLLLNLYWRAERAPDRDFQITLEIVDEAGQIAAQITMPPAPTHPSGQWSAGEIVRGRHWLELPASMDSGAYALRLELVGAGGGSVSLGEGGQFTVTAPQRRTEIPPMQHRLEANFAEQATLLGYDLEPDTLHLTLYWRAEQPLKRSYAVFVHLLDADSRIVAQHDGLPANWTRPTTGWLTGEIIADPHPLTLESDLSPGEYLLEVGLYDPETNIRLPVLNAAGDITADRLLLEPVSLGP